MARKSRKNNSQPEPKVEIEQVSYVTAIYARLSVENSGKQDEGASCKIRLMSAKSMWPDAPISDCQRYMPTMERQELCLTGPRGTV